MALFHVVESRWMIQRARVLDTSQAVEPPWRFCRLLAAPRRHRLGAQRKVQRLVESATERGRSLWDAIYDFVRSKPVVTRREVLERFRGDDEELVRGVLAGLVESNLVFASGPTQATSFRAASDGELGDMVRHHQQRADADLVWALVFRLGPISAETG
jgi:hypothetical protein